MGIIVFDIFIPYYGLMIVLGLIFASTISFYLCQKKDLNIDDLIVVSSVISLGAIFGGKILYLLLNLKEIYYLNFSDLRTLNLIISSGFVFYGSLIGGLISILILKAFLKCNIKEYIKIIIVVIPLIHGFGRIGCYLVGCCYGIVYNSKNFPTRIYNNSMIAPNNIPLFPIQLIESICNFGIFIILFIYYLNSKRHKYIIDIYLIVYSITRFILEFFRGDRERGVIFGISTSQMISIVIIFMVILNILIIRSKEKNNGK